MPGQKYLSTAEAHCPVTNKKPFLQAGFLDYLERLPESSTAAADAALPSLIAQILLASDHDGQLSNAGEYLIALLQARRAMLQAAFDTELVADELRRYQKFSKPGQPSPHIVGLRQKQAAARQASNVAKQSFVKAAAAFVREVGINVPQRVAIEVFIDQWIDANVPKAFAPAA
jgi:hypothetical protein